VDLQTLKFRCGTNEEADATSKNAIKREYMLKFICNGNKTQWQQQRSVLFFFVEACHLPPRQA
jgi:hypothetical protein